MPSNIDKEQSLGESLAHLGGLTSTTALGSLLDLPGNAAAFIPQTLTQLADWGLKKAGATGPSVQEMYQKGQQAIEKSGGSQPHLPYAGESAELLHKVTEGYSRPKGEGEQLYADFVDILTNIAATEGLGAGPAIFDKLKNYGKAGKAVSYGGRALYQGARAAGSLVGGKLLQDYPWANLPFQMAFMGLSRNPKALASAQAMKELVFNQSDALSKDKTTFAEFIRNPIKAIKKEMPKRHQMKDVNIVNDAIKSVEAILGEEETPKISKTKKQPQSPILDPQGQPYPGAEAAPSPAAERTSGMVKVDDVKTAIKDINKNIYQFSYDTEAVKILEQIKSQLIKVIDQFNEANPEHGQLWNLGNELHAATAEKNMFVKAMEKFGWSPKTNLVYSLLGGAGTALSGGSIPAAAGAALVGREMGRTAELMWKSPYARKAYMNTYLSGIHGDINATIKNAKVLDREAEKTMEKTGHGIIIHKGGYKK